MVSPKSRRMRVDTQAGTRRGMIVVGGLLAAAILAGAARAGPCTSEIDDLQRQVDAQIDATAGAGHTGRESLAAGGHAQPTPGSITRAEEQLGEGSHFQPALAALERARRADQAGDATGCLEALRDVRSALGLSPFERRSALSTSPCPSPHRCGAATLAVLDRGPGWWLVPVPQPT
jgi:hypothetical protein